MRKTITGCLALALTLTSASAWAQEFGDKGTLAISGDRLSGIYLTQRNYEPDNWEDDDATEVGLLWSGTGLTPYTIPRLSIDYFVIDHLSVGGSIAYYNIDDDDAGGWDNYFLFAPRVGGAFMFNDWAGIWPRGGIHYYSVGDGEGDHFWQLALNLEAAVVLSPWQNFAFTVGPAFDIGMLGEYEWDPPGPDNEDSFDVHVHSFGILSVGIMGYFNL